MARDGSGRGIAGLRVGGRVVAVAGISALVVLSGQLLTSAGPKPPSTGGPSTVATGAWFCPHGGGDGWGGWIAVANPGLAAVRVRLSTFSATRAPVVQDVRVAPSHEAYVKVDATDPAASTEVEYFGGWVAAGAVVRSSGSHADVAAERCVAGARRQWLMPDVTTRADEDASLVVMNPFDIAAEFDVVLRTNQRASIRPGELTPVVLKPHSSTSIPVSTFALEGAGEDTVTAQVVPVIGRVIAGSLVTSSGEVRAEAGIQTASPRWLIPASGYTIPAKLVVMNIGSRPAVLQVVSQGVSADQLVPGISGATIDAGTVRTFDVDGLANAGIQVDATRGEVAIALRLSGTNGGADTVVGSTGAGRRWVMLPTLPDTGGRAGLILQNPTRTASVATVQWIGPDGPVGAARSVQVPAGRTLTVSSSRSGVPLAAVVTVRGGAISCGGSSVSLAGVAYAATTGVLIP